MYDYLPSVSSDLTNGLLLLLVLITAAVYQAGIININILLSCHIWGRDVRTHDAVYTHDASVAQLCSYIQTAVALYAGGPQRV